MAPLPETLADLQSPEHHKAIFPHPMREKPGHRPDDENEWAHVFLLSPIPMKNRPAQAVVLFIL